MKTYSRNSKSFSSNIDLVLPKEFKNACRLCLAKDNVVKQLYNEDNNILIPLKIRYCLAIEVNEDDGLPDGICSGCVSLLEQSYAFKKRCLASDMKLRQFTKYEHDEFRSTFKQNNSEENTLLNEVEDCGKGRDACTVGIDQLMLMPKSKTDSVVEEIDISDDDEVVCALLSKDVECEQSILEEQSSLLFQEDDNSDRCSDDYHDTQRRSERLSKKSRGEETMSSDDEQKSLRSHDTTKSMRNNYKCSYCGIKFKIYSSFYDHINENHPQGVKVCAICEKKFITNSTLKRHMRIHTGERPFNCNLCGKSFSQKEILHRHRTMMHLKKKSFKCKFCVFKTRKAESLNIHLQVVHLEKKQFNRYKCSKCDKTFYYKSGLSRHQRMHTGVLYQCVICKKVYSDSSAARRHCLRAHPEAYASSHDKDVCTVYLQIPDGSKKHDKKVKISNNCYVIGVE